MPLSLLVLFNYSTFPTYCYPINFIVRMTIINFRGNAGRIRAEKFKQEANYQGNQY